MDGSGNCLPVPVSRPKKLGILGVNYIYAVFVGIGA